MCFNRLYQGDSSSSSPEWLAGWTLKEKTHEREGRGTSRELESSVCSYALEDNVHVLLRSRARAEAVSLLAGYNFAARERC